MNNYIFVLVDGFEITIPAATRVVAMEFFAEHYNEMIKDLVTIKVEGWDIPVTNIEFINEDGNLDETQFDTQDEKELAELWWDFCKENNIIIEVNKGIADYESGVIK